MWSVVWVAVLNCQTSSLSLSHTHTHTHAHTHKHTHTHTHTYTHTHSHTHTHTLTLTHSHTLWCGLQPLGFTVNAFHGKLDSESNLGLQRKGVDRVATQGKNITRDSVEIWNDTLLYMAQSFCRSLPVINNWNLDYVFQFTNKGIW
jgi:hypothetical protein